MDKKIYITALHLQHGGVEMAITLLANALDARGYKVRILCTYDLGSPAYKINSNIEILYLTSVRPNKEEIKKVLKKRQYPSFIKEAFYAMKVLWLKHYTMKKALNTIENGAVVLTRLEHAVIASKCMKAPVKKVAQLHQDHQFSAKYIKIFRKKMKNIDIFTVLTEELKTEVEGFMNGYNNYTKCVAIPNFLIDATRDGYNTLREKTVIAVGRIHPVKGFLRLIDIWKVVNLKEPLWKLKIIGDGDKEECYKLEKKIEELGLKKSIDIAGALPHNSVMREMQNASIFAMTSFTEAFPFVMLEAMQKGLPTVAFDVRVGPRAIITSGMDGCLIRDHDLKGFADKLLELMQNSVLRDEMSISAIKKAKKYEEKNVIEQWIEILGESYE